MIARQNVAVRDMIKDWMAVLEVEIETRPTPGHAVHLYKLRKITDEYVRVGEPIQNALSEKSWNSSRIITHFFENEESWFAHLGHELTQVPPFLFVSLSLCLSDCLSTSHVCASLFASFSCPSLSPHLLLSSLFS